MKSEVLRRVLSDARSGQVVFVFALHAESERALPGRRRTTRSL